MTKLDSILKSRDITLPRKVIIREKQIEISSRYYFTAIRQEIRKNRDRESKRDRGPGEGNHPTVIWGR